MINFCTLFNSNYLTRGIALNESLQRVCASYHLYIIAFDDACYEYLYNSGIPNITVISLAAFEDEKLLAIKPTRNAAEYCWTCTPSALLYCIEKYHLPACTYIDADLLFYQDPKILLDEMGGASVLITEHNYTQLYDVSATHGKYCVQFMCFKNNINGMTALKWWRESCLDWCYDRLEDGRFGDQKYLDDWLTRFDGVHVLRHEGGGVAPWNIQQYTLVNKADELYIKNKRNQNLFPLIFYHFHGLKFYSNDWVTCSGVLYEFTGDIKEQRYIPYIKQLVQIEKELKKKGIAWNVSGARSKAPSKPVTFLQYVKSLLLLIRSGKAASLDIKSFNFNQHYHFYNLNLFKE